MRFAIAASRLFLLFNALWPNMVGCWWGINGGIDALVEYNGSLYVGGNFDSVYNPGAQAANNIASWNGTAWASLGSGVINQLSQNAYISALVVYNGELYATGNFDSAGSSYTSNIARWNGSSWQVMNPGISNNSSGYALAVYNGKLFLGGIFDSAGGVPAHNVASWDGTNWAALDGGVYGNPSTVMVNAFTVYNNILVVGGVFSSMGSNHVGINNIAAWDGNNWSTFGNGLGDTSSEGYAVEAFAVYDNNLYASGFFKTAGSVFAQNIAEWNGSSWSALASGLGNVSDTTAYVYCLLPFNGSLIAGGYFATTGDGTPMGNIASWNGSSWSALSLGVTNTQDATLGAVLALAQWNGNLYAGGEFDKAGIIHAYGIAEWSEPTGIEQLASDSKPGIYPNPANEHIVFAGMAPGTPVTITDLLGRAILKVTASSTRQSIDVSSLSSGMYFVNGAKFIKE